MKDFLRALVRKATSQVQGRNIAREYLQARILQSLQRAGAMIPLAFQRPYLKGRDVFDLVWYLSDPTWPPPNLTLLSAALAQTSYEGPRITASTWRRALRERLESSDLERARADVEPFLETAADRDLVTLQSLKKLLRG